MNEKQLSVYQKENGQWYYTGKELTEDLTIQYVERGGYPDAVAAVIACQESEKKFNDFLASVQKDVPSGSYTFKEYLIYWYHKILIPRSDDSTKLTRGYELYNFILPNLGVYENTMLDQITSSVLTWLIKRCGTLCQSAAAQVRKFLSAAFLDATLDGYIRENPMSGVEYFSYPHVSPPVVYNKKQLKTFVQYCIHKYPSIKLEVFLALFCGMRTGEIRGLRFDDCDDSNYTIHISRQIVVKTDLCFTGESVSVQKRGNKEKAPKTESSDRIIRVHPVIFDTLKERKEEIAVARQKSKFWTSEYDGYVTIGQYGNIKAPSTINCALRNIAGHTGLPIISTHDLRHMAATLLLESCLKNNAGPTDVRDTYSYFADTLRRVSRYLGHSSIRTTYEIYIHQLYGSEQIRTVAENVMNPMNTFQQKGDKT